MPPDVQCAGMSTPNRDPTRTGLVDSTDSTKATSVPCRICRLTVEPVRSPSSAMNGRANSHRDVLGASACARATRAGPVT